MKVIPFSGRHFKRQKHPPLTAKMFYALLVAVQKQERKIGFSPGITKGPLTRLIERGLIIRKRIMVKGHLEYQWQVSTEAIVKLRKIGIKV